MTELTVVGNVLAKKGLVFVYMGPSNECKECKVKNICFHLQKGARYKVKDVRDVKHECLLHEDGVKVVEVERVPTPGALDKKTAIDGSNITLALPKCRDFSCKSRPLCFATGLENGQRLKIIKVKRKLKCSQGHDRVEVVFE